MIDSTFHVELNGVKYTLAEDGEGAHYQWRREPLRAPTNGFVLGDTNKFNLRPDILEWSLTDWSGGEGYKVFAQETSNGYYIGYDVDPFREYGTLRLAKEVVVTTDNAAATFENSVSLVYSLDTLWGIFLDVSEADAVAGLIEWDFANDRWGSTVANGAQVADGNFGGIGAGGLIYYGEDSVELFRFHVNAASFTSFVAGNYARYGIAGPVSSQLFFATLTTASGQFGVEVREVQVTDAAPATSTLLYQDVFADSGAVGVLAEFPPKITAGSNAGYLMYNPRKGECVVIELTPTTAAGAGFGAEIFRLKGFTGEAVVALLGFVYIIGRMGDETVIAYVNPSDTTYGILGALGPDRSVASIGVGDEFQWSVATEGHEPFKAYFIHSSGQVAGDRTVVVIDGVKGAFAGTSVFNFPYGNEDQQWPGSTQLFEGNLFVALSNTTTGTVASRVFRQTDNYTDGTGVLISSINDFGLVDNKILTSISLSTDPLPTNSTVAVEYQLNQDGVWHTAGTMSVAGTKEQTFVVSTDTTTREFTNLQLRLELDNGGTLTNSPVVRSVRARATVIEGVNVWSLILNATDELGQMQNRSWDGATLITNITDSADGNAVVAFKDGYTARNPGSFREYDVVIDEYTVLADRPGEGTVQVNLREVV